MDKAKLTKEVDWFCQHATQEQLLTVDSCIAVIDVIEENNLDLTLELFLSVVKDNGLCSVPDRLDGLAAMSREEAQVFGFPPRSVFDENAVPQAPAAPANAVAQEPPQPQAAPQFQQSGIQRKCLEGAPEWTYGWPRLADAADMGPDEARELLNAFLHKARELDCSDVHISACALPYVRRYKLMYLLGDQEELSPQAAANLNLSALNEEQRQIFDKAHDLDYGYNISADDRYRTNIMMHRLGIQGSYRVIDTRVRTISELGFRMPEVVEKLTNYGQGLILVTGPGGSGKSTTLAAMVDHINRSRHDHIITVEDPIEIIHPSIGCNVTQRELNSHTKSFGNALRAALREDPDVIVIGELRDLETIEMAIHSSETGHLVIGTLHTSSAADTMNRVLDVFPPGQQPQIRAMIAESLRGIICQQLLPNKDGSGVVMAYEILLGNLAVSNLIREGKTFQLDSTIQTSKNVGMTSMEQCHFDLYMDGVRSYEQTTAYVKNAELLKKMNQHEAELLAAAAAAQNEGKPAKKKGWF